MCTIFRLDDAIPSVINDYTDLRPAASIYENDSGDRDWRISPTGQPSHPFMFFSSDLGHFIKKQT